jgi:FlaG/FlaF family flagellin (archaellin)
MAVTESEVTKALSAGSSTLHSGVKIDQNSANKVKRFTIDHSEFTDGGGASGTYTLPLKIPAPSAFEGWDYVAEEGFAGDTTAVLTVGDGSVADRFCDDAGGDSVFADGAKSVYSVGDPAHVHADVNPVITTETSVVLTVTTSTDFGKVTAGKLSFTLFYRHLER